MNNQFEKNFALAKKHENQLIACLEDYFGSSFAPTDLGEDKYRKVDFFSNCHQKISVGARVCRHTAWEYRSQVTISDNKSIHKSEHDEWMVAGKGPDYFIYGHIAPDEKELQMVVLVSLPMLRTKTGRRINKDDKDGFFVYPITDPGVVLCCWYSPEVRDDSIINILSGPKKPFEPAKKHAHSTSKGVSPNMQHQTQKRLRRYTIATLLFVSGVVFGIYFDLGIDQNEDIKQEVESPKSNLIAAEDAMAHIGQIGTVCGEVVSTKYAVHSTGRPTYLNISRPYPNQIFTAVIWGEYRRQFDILEHRYKGKWICVTGKITEYQGGAQIELQEKKYLSEVDGPTFKYVKKLLSRQ